MNRLGLVGITPLLVVAGVYNAARYVAAVIGDPQKATAMAFTVDQLTNVGTNGRTDMTISARAGYAARKKERWGCVLCGVLNKFNPGHCENAIADYEHNTPPRA